MLTTPPGFLLSLITIGIARARWISSTNRALNHGTGFLFAYFLQAFANYGLTGRLNEALAVAGTSHRESPLLCFFLTGFPFIGARKRHKRAVERLNDANRVRQQAAAPAA